MRQFRSGAVALLLFGALLFGCDQARELTGFLSDNERSAIEKPSESSGGILSPNSLVPDTIVLNGFTVVYLGRDTINNTTKFSYRVSGPAADMHFRLELPGCAPSHIAAFPANGVTSNNDCCINPGIEWHPATGSGPFTFSITYPGIVREGIILCSVKRTNSTVVGQITGACARIFDIGGSAYTDTDKNGLRGASETGINNALVRLFNSSNTELASTLTNSAGAYIFRDLLAGTYFVRIDVSSIPSNYVEATSPTELTVVVGPSSFNNNFGFAPKTDKILNDLKFGTIRTNGAAVNFWRKQFNAAITGRGRAEVDSATLRILMQRVEGLLLVEPFQFPQGFVTAYDILNSNSRDPIEKLKKELLATELNHVAGWGIQGAEAALQLVLIGWGESLIASQTTPLRMGPGDSEVETATKIFYDINSGGGGGTID